jgi:hypothetical protein
MQRSMGTDATGYWNGSLALLLPGMYIYILYVIYVYVGGSMLRTTKDLVVCCINSRRFSHIHSILLKTRVTEQASDQLCDGVARPRGPGTGDADADEDLDIMFSPAEHTDSLVGRTDKKRRKQAQQW